eukprot:TRINITY_DN31499_c0_g1_i1.p1 TRINITY_DN31499_c0_g1~~TRINITY_DN31499_c0_g1_i1.p1  ORF type:complete len:275 (+),score=69.05 TRINITY_DN31499_c0_g1_i1:112-936(+)
MKGQGPGGMPFNPAQQQFAIQQAQMAAFAMQNRYSGGGFPGSPYPSYGGGGGWPQMGGMPGQGPMTSASSGGKGDGKSFRGGKGNGKSGKKGGGRGFKGGKGNGSADGGYAPGDPRSAIERAQASAFHRGRRDISQAQKAAQDRFEKDLLQRVQGHWIDDSDMPAHYVVEGNLCSVLGPDENARVFRNRLSVNNSELVWDAKRFWYNLKLDSLPPVGEQAQRVEWTAGQGSPKNETVVWLRCADPAPAIFTRSPAVGGMEEPDMIACDFGGQAS